MIRWSHIHKRSQHALNVQKMFYLTNILQMLPGFKQMFAKHFMCVCYTFTVCQLMFEEHNKVERTGLSDFVADFLSYVPATVRYSHNAKVLQQH